jgi:hypothetical protein
MTHSTIAGILHLHNCFGEMNFAHLVYGYFIYDFRIYNDFCLCLAARCCQGLVQYG